MNDQIGLQRARGLDRLQNGDDSRRLEADAIEAGGGVQADFTSLMNLISTTVQPDSWEDLSGPGSIMPVTLPDQSRTLAIRQTQAVHDEVSRLLADLRKARRTEGDEGVRPIVVSDDESSAARREAVAVA